MRDYREHRRASANWRRRNITDEAPAPPSEAELDREECPECGETYDPESDRTELNLGKPDYCSLACRLDAEDDE